MLDKLLKNPQSTAYLLAVFTFMAVVLGSLFAQIYQTTTGKGSASAALTDNMKSAMLVLSGMLAASSMVGHKGKEEPPPTLENPVLTQIVGGQGGPGSSVETEEEKP